MTSYSLALREVDSVQNNGEYVPSALEAIVRKGHLDLLTGEVLWRELLKWLPDDL